MYLGMVGMHPCILPRSCSGMHGQIHSRSRSPVGQRVVSVHCIIGGMGFYGHTDAGMG
jgi:hypothetical protein